MKSESLSRGRDLERDLVLLLAGLGWILLGFTWPSTPHSAHRTPHARTAFDANPAPFAVSPTHEHQRPIDEGAPESEARETLPALPHESNAPPFWSPNYTRARRGPRSAVAPPDLAGLRRIAEGRHRQPRPTTVAVQHPSASERWAPARDNTRARGISTCLSKSRPESTKKVCRPVQI